MQDYIVKIRVKAPNDGVAILFASEMYDACEDAESFISHFDVILNKGTLTDKEYQEDENIHNEYDDYMSKGIRQ